MKNNTQGMRTLGAAKHATQAQMSWNRHKAKCGICRYGLRCVKSDKMKAEVLHWASSAKIASEMYKTTTPSK